MVWAFRGRIVVPSLTNLFRPTSTTFPGAKLLANVFAITICSLQLKLCLTAQNGRHSQIMRLNNIIKMNINLHV